MPFARRGVPEARDVNPVGTFRLVRIRKSFEFWQTTRRSRAYDVIHQIMAQRAARIRQSIWVFPSGRVQQDAGGLQCLRAKDHRFSADLLHLPRQAIHVSHTARFVWLRVHVHMAYHGIGKQRAVPGGQRVLDGRKRAAEVRKRAAPAFARPAIMASEASIVILRQDRRAPNRDRVPELRFDAFSELNFSAAHFHWREKLPVRQHLISLRRSADTYVPLHDVVIRCKIGIANRPVIAIPVAARRLKIVIAQPVTLTAPDQ